MSYSPHKTLDELLRAARSRTVLEVFARVKGLLPNKPTYQSCEQGILANYQHIEQLLPQVLQGGLRILDIGPGIGSFMLIARAFENAVEGEDTNAVAGTTAWAYSEVTKLWNLRVRYYGFQHLFSHSQPAHVGIFDLIHFRGSLDAILVAAALPLETATARLATFLHLNLREGGRAWIGHNLGSSNEEIATALRQQRGSLQLIQDTLGVTELKK